MGPEQRVQAKIKMIKEADRDAVLSALNEKTLSLRKRSATNFSTLIPFQNYTSTSEDLYKETIEKRKVRKAIEKINMGQAPVSIVEKKKQERLIKSIEQTVSRKPDFDPGRFSIATMKSVREVLNESSCKKTVKSISLSPVAQHSETKLKP